MNKKILIISILAVLMLITITFASAINTTTTNTKKRESPLFGIRTRLEIGEKIIQILKNIKTKFIDERIFFLPNLLFKNKGNGVLSTKYEYTCFPPTGSCGTCFGDTSGCPTCNRRCLE